MNVVDGTEQVQYVLHRPDGCGSCCINCCSISGVIMTESSLSKLDDKGVFTIVKVENVERKVGKEIITEVNIETEEEFDGIKKFYTSRKMIVTKFFSNGKPTTLSQDIQKGKKYRVKIITQKFGNGKEDYDIAKS
mgnify:CR=1 FL=1